jgi:hypothetical protein
MFETNDQEIHVSLQEAIVGVCPLQIFDASGRLLKSMNLIDMETSIQLTEGPGVYFVQLEMNQQIFSKKLVITQK